MQRILFSFMLVFISTTRVLACECFGKGKISIQDFNETPLIFVGTIADIQPIGSFDVKVKYTVVKWYKHGNISNDTAYVVTNTDLGACGLGELKKNDRHLVFAYGDSLYFTGSCTRTTRVPTHVWPKDSSIINRLLQSNSFGEIYRANTNFHSDTVFLNKVIHDILKPNYQKFYHTNGKLSAEGKFKNGVPDEYWKYYDQDGDIGLEGTYVKGLKHGLWKEYENYFAKLDNNIIPTTIYIREWVHGRATLKQKRYNGNRLAEEQYPLQNSANWVETRYHDNGKLKSYVIAGPLRIGKYGKREMGYWNGTGRFYYENGKLEEEGEFYNGIKTGVWKYYDKSGKLTKTENEKTTVEIDEILRREAERKIPKVEYVK